MRRTGRKCPWTVLTADRQKLPLMPGFRRPPRAQTAPGRASNKPVRCATFAKSGLSEACLMRAFACNCSRGQTPCSGACYCNPGVSAQCETRIRGTLVHVVCVQARNKTKEKHRSLQSHDYTLPVWSRLRAKCWGPAGSSGSGPCP